MRHNLRRGHISRLGYCQRVHILFEWEVLVLSTNRRPWKLLDFRNPIHLRSDHTGREAHVQPSGHPVSKLYYSYHFFYWRIRRFHREYWCLVKWKLRWSRIELWGWSIKLDWLGNKLGGLRNKLAWCLIELLHFPKLWTEWWIWSFNQQGACLTEAKVIKGSPHLWDPLNIKRWESRY